MRKLLVYIVLLMLTLSCINSNNKGAFAKEPVITDTTDALGRKIRIYGNDSIAWFYDDNDTNNRIRKVKYIADTIVGNILYKDFDFGLGVPKKHVYITDTIKGALHYKEFYNNKLWRQAYVSDTLWFDTTGMNLAFFRSDFVEQYSADGRIAENGYIGYTSEEAYITCSYYDIFGVWTSYDSLGRVSHVETPLDEGGSDVVHDIFYSNSQLWQRIVQSNGKYGKGGVTLSMLEYDPLGHKVQEVNNEHFVTEYDLFQVSTIKDYFSNGKLKRLSYTKTFYESDACACGKWIYYDENGKVIKTQKYTDCYNYKLDCEEYYYGEE